MYVLTVLTWTILILVGMELLTLMYLWWARHRVRSKTKREYLSSVKRVASYEIPLHLSDSTGIEPDLPIPFDADHQRTGTQESKSGVPVDHTLNKRSKSTNQD